MAVMKKIYAGIVMILIFTLNFVVLAQDEAKETQLVLTNKNVCVNNVQSSCVLILSSYLDNCLVDTCFIDVDGDAEYAFYDLADFTYSYEDVDMVKAFLLSCVNRLKPVCESKSVEIREPEMLEFTLLEDDTYSVRAGRDIADYETVEIPEMYNSKSVTQIENEGFYNIDTIKSVNIPNTVTVIGNSAFYGCNSLSRVDFGISLKSIGKYAFYYCTSLTKVTIPSTTDFIGKYSFAFSGLKSVNLNDSENWILENNIKTNTAWMPSANTFSTYNQSGDIYYMLLDLDNPSVVANALRENMTFEIKRVLYNQTLYGNADFYTENWIKS